MWKWVDYKLYLLPKKRKIYEKCLQQCLLCQKWLTGQTLRWSHDCRKPSQKKKRPFKTTEALEAKEEPKEEAKEEPKEEAKEEPKEEAKEEPKEEPKEEKYD